MAGYPINIKPGCFCGQHGFECNCQPLVEGSIFTDYFDRSVKFMVASGCLSRYSDALAASLINPVWCLVLESGLATEVGKVLPFSERQIMI